MFFQPSPIISEQLVQRITLQRTGSQHQKGLEIKELCFNNSPKVWQAIMKYLASESVLLPSLPPEATLSYWVTLQQDRSPRNPHVVSTGFVNTAPLPLFVQNIQKNQKNPSKASLGLIYWGLQELMVMHRKFPHCEVCSFSTSTIHLQSKHHRRMEKPSQSLHNRWTI